MLQKTSQASINSELQNQDVVSPFSSLPLISQRSHPLCLCIHAEPRQASTADPHNHTSLQQSIK